MSLFDKINEDIKAAMMAKEAGKLEALRSIKAAFLIAKTEKNSSELTEEKELAIVSKLVKQRKESGEIYRTNNREDLATKEFFEAGIIEAYLPAKMSDSEIEAVIKSIIDENNFCSAADFGKVMGFAMKKLSGKADNKTISEKIKLLLQ